MNGGRKIKITIIILSVLLMLSLLVLGGIILHNHLSEGKNTEVIVPANVITDEKEQDSPKPEAGTSHNEAETPEQNMDTNSSTDRASGSSETEQAGEDAKAVVISLHSRRAEDNTPRASGSSETEQAGEDAKAVVISLHSRRAEDNTPFRTENMFPGDSETKYYCMQVSHKDNVTLCFHADIRPGYEKLAEVLHCRITLPEKNTVLYDGLMCDMPKALEQTLKTSVSTKSEIYYEITAYLETSVGNEYMDKSLVADLRWWVEEIGHLDPPQTGDSSNLYLWMGMAVGSLLVLLLLLLKKRKQEDEAGEQ